MEIKSWGITLRYIEIWENIKYVRIHKTVVYLSSFQMNWHKYPVRTGNILAWLERKIHSSRKAGAKSWPVGWTWHLQMAFPFVHRTYHSTLYRLIFQSSHPTKLFWAAASIHKSRSRAFWVTQQKQLPSMTLWSDQLKRWCSVKQ